MLVRDTQEREKWDPHVGNDGTFVTGVDGVGRVVRGLVERVVPLYRGLRVRAYSR